MRDECLTRRRLHVVVCHFRDLDLPMKMQSVVVAIDGYYGRTEDTKIDILLL